MDHYYKTVEGWAAFEKVYVDMVAAAPRDKPSTFVEIGSWLGRSAALMGVEIINSGKPIQLYCVDPWIDGGPDLRNTAHFKKQSRPIYDIFRENIERVRMCVLPIKAFSVDAAKNFEDGSVDFIMIDGDHSYEGCLADIKAWRPKMKPGGIMAGDDYLWPGVTQAVKEQFAGSDHEVVVKKAHHNYLNSASYWIAKP